MPNRIKPLRHEYGMNQKELGEKLGVGQTTVSAWETGKNEPDSEILRKMATLFRCSIGYLMGFENDERSRGLTDEQLEAYYLHEQDELMFDRYERNRNRDIEEEAELFERKNTIRNGQKESPGKYPEVYLIEKLMENMTAIQRRSAVEMIEALNRAISE